MCYDCGQNNYKSESKWSECEKLKSNERISTKRTTKTVKSPIKCPNMKNVNKSKQKNNYLYKTICKDKYNRHDPTTTTGLLKALSLNRHLCRG